MATAVKTIMSIPSMNSDYPIPGDFQEAQLRSMYTGQIPQLANMVATSTEATTPEGVVRTIVFAPRTGQKG